MSSLAPHDVDVGFHRPALVGREQEYLVDALRSGRCGGDGPYTARCRELLESLLGAPRVLLTTSCTAALELSALLLDVGPGDEIIVPSFTFVSTASAFVLRGASIRFADIRPDTLNIDERQVESLVTSRTKAIVPVHYAGVACEMDTLTSIASHHGLVIVEDNAHGLLGRYKGRPLGSFGALATQSFHETKNFTCGEGGALVVNDPALVERAEILREKGTDRSRFLRGLVDKYTWVDVGSSFLPSDLLAAVLYGQLEAREHIQAARRALWRCYYEALSPWAAERNVAMPVTPSHCESACHLFFMLFPTASARQDAIDHLKARGVAAVFHYQPLHASPMGKLHSAAYSACPVAEDVSRRLLRLPLYPGLGRQQDRVIEALMTLPSTHV
jgi:dTDP-4-amino-4,6-dideoxygalactose transaminase